MFRVYCKMVTGLRVANANSVKVWLWTRSGVNPLSFVSSILFRAASFQRGVQGSNANVVGEISGSICTSQVSKSVSSLQYGFLIPASHW